ncbi:thiamine ABC transporter substrate-binding protein [Acidipropionibacterium jensenii]|uniref:thiamine ABC transporter substrate-binding protein n=1 Tax=Acidipropionibacterium jensenii TaxID=1749 RepID=UPI000BC2CB03|nr:thiamine ABC transporter substrate-binding protein [Acidipropionibacterium jensenii]AZZ41248.1 thiamine ABC transporter substrate-binding protein [Acidipropionibacterium jensenii]
MFGIRDRHAGLAVLLAAAMALAGCGSSGGSSSAGSASGSATPSKDVTIVTHDSWAMSKNVVAEFTKKTGYRPKFVSQGDAGAVVNQMILTKDSPLGDAVFGIDNTFSGRAIQAGVLDPYSSAALPASAKDAAQDTDGKLTPIDRGDVCINADDGWFSAKKLAVPTTLDDLAKPQYKNLLVVSSPATSSPGMAFLAATVGAKGENGWKGYWTSLKNNGVKVDKGWQDAYNVDFSAGQGKGRYPLVLSYSTSPADTVSKDGKTTATSALLNTCFRQTEYAGVIHGAKNPAGAKAFVDFLLSKDAQADIPGQMYMYPIDSSVALPAEWKKFAPLSPKPFTVDPKTLSVNRNTWIKEWTETVQG